MISQEVFQEYQDFSEYTQELLRKDTQWKLLYAGYAKKMLQNKEQMIMKRKMLGSQNHLAPLHCYTTIGAIKGDADFDFDLRFLGQSVGTITVIEGKPILQVSEKKAETSRREFGYDVGPIDGEVWNVGEKAKAFKAYYDDAIEQPDRRPRQPEHMVESALFTELEKKHGDAKALKYIQPITCIDDVRLHMKTALYASSVSKSALAMPTVSSTGGEIDAFCRRKVGNRSRLTVIEIKDENDSREPFHQVIRQAIAYAVFVRELVRSESGRDWMELWGLGNQPWEGGFTINAAVAMPKGNTEQFPFAGIKLELKGKKPEDPTDWIELHYIAFLGKDKPRDGQNVRFETSL